MKHCGMLPCSGTDVHTVASLLKLYLRLLPEPLVPYKRYQDFLICSQKLTNDRTAVRAAESSHRPTAGQVQLCVFADLQWWKASLRRHPE